MTTPIPSPIWVTPSQPTTLSSQKWRAIYCRDGFNESCLDQMVFATAANHRTTEQRDLGMKVAVAGVNQAMRKMVEGGKNSLSPLEQEQVALFLNNVVKKYKEARDQPGAEWSTLDSVDKMLEVMKKVPVAGAGLAVEINQFILNAAKEMAGPFRQLSVEQNYLAAYQYSKSFDDQFGELYLNAHVINGLSNAVDPALSYFLGLTTQDSAESTLNNDPLLAALFLSKENNALLKAILAEVKGGKKLTKEGLTKIAAKLEEQKVAMGNGLPAPAVDADEAERLRQSARIADYETSLRIFSTLASILPDPDMREFAVKSSTIAGAALTIYKAYLNPEKLSKLVLTGNVVEAVAGVFKLFMGGPDPEQVILEQIAGLRKDVEALHQTVLQGFEVLNQEIETVYKTLVEGFTQIYDDGKVTHEMLQNVQLQLQGINDHLARIEKQIGAAFDNIAKRLTESQLPFIRCFDEPMYIDGERPTEQDFRDCATLLVKEAALYCTRFPAVDISEEDMQQLASSPADLLNGGAHTYDYNAAAIEGVLSGEDPLRRLNYIASAYMLHVGTLVFPLEDGKPVVVPDPRSWLIAANSLVKLMELHPAYSKEITRKALEDIRERGEQIQRFVRNVRTPATQKRLSDAIRAAHAALLEKLAALEDAYLQQFGLQNFKAIFWGELPTETSVNPTLPDKLPAGMLHTEKDLGITLPASELPQFARVAVQLGAGSLTISSEYRGDDDGQGNHWMEEEHVQTWSLPVMGGAFVAPQQIGGRVSAHLQVRSLVQIQKWPVMECVNRSHEKLWIGSYVATRTMVFEPWVPGQPLKPPRPVDKVTERSVRTNGDVTQNVWEDGNYQLRDRLTCQGMPDPDGQVVAESRRLWGVRQEELKSLMVTGLSGKAAADFAAPRQEIAHAAKVLNSLYTLALASLPLGLGKNIRETDNLVAMLYGGDVKMDADGIILWLQGNPGVHARPLLTELGEGMDAADNKLEASLQAAAVAGSQQTETLVDIDVMVAQIKALEAAAP